ncbi:MAG: energy transducer TonB [Ignavibacteriaceae bacterium]
MKCLSLFILSLTLFIMGCGHYIENSENYTPPSLKSEPRLFYPMEALEKSYSGTPKVIIYISKNGSVERSTILKSSGIGILDSAAVEYSKNFIFNPARINGEPINSRMALEIKFEFSNQKWDANDYVEDITDLYNQIAKASPNDRIAIEKEILKMHDYFISKMRDMFNYNHVIGLVIEPGLYNEWKNDWNSWPLSFLLFQDFIQRFPDFNNLDLIKEELKNSLKSDIQYIKSTHSNSRVTILEKEIILSKIKKFVETKYPDMINDLGLDAKIDSLSVF